MPNPLPLPPTFSNVIIAGPSDMELLLEDVRKQHIAPSPKGGVVSPRIGQTYVVQTDRFTDGFRWVSGKQYRGDLRIDVSETMRKSCCGTTVVINDESVTVRVVSYLPLNPEGETFLMTYSQWRENSSFAIDAHMNDGSAVLDLPASSTLHGVGSGFDSTNDALARSPPDDIIIHQADFIGTCGATSAGTMVINGTSPLVGTCGYFSPGPVPVELDGFSSTSLHTTGSPDGWDDSSDSSVSSRSHDSDVLDVTCGSPDLDDELFLSLNCAETSDHWTLISTECQSHGDHEDPFVSLYPEASTIYANVVTEHLVVFNRFRTKVEQLNHESAGSLHSFMRSYFMNSNSVIFHVVAVREGDGSGVRFSFCTTERDDLTAYTIQRLIPLLNDKSPLVSNSVWALARIAAPDQSGSRWLRRTAEHYLESGNPEHYLARHHKREATIDDLMTHGKLTTQRVLGEAKGLVDDYQVMFRNWLIMLLAILDVFSKNTPQLTVQYIDITHWYLYRLSGMEQDVAASVELHHTCSGKSYTEITARWKEVLSELMVSVKRKPLGPNRVPTSNEYELTDILGEIMGEWNVSGNLLCHSDHQQYNRSYHTEVTKIRQVLIEHAGPPLIPNYLPSFLEQAIDGRRKELECCRPESGLSPPPFDLNAVLNLRPWVSVEGVDLSKL